MPVYHLSHYRATCHERTPRCLVEWWYTSVDHPRNLVGRSRVGTRVHGQFPTSWLRTTLLIPRLSCEAPYSCSCSRWSSSPVTPPCSGRSSRRRRLTRERKWVHQSAFAGTDSCQDSRTNPLLEGEKSERQP